MDFLLKFKLNDHLYLRDPENSGLGKSMVQNAIELIYEIGFEQFTFKKLAVKIDTTEASIYRYFQSKHKLLIYILNWYWNYLEFTANMKLMQVKEPTMRLTLVLEIITHNDEAGSKIQDYDLDHLHSIVISESSKSYLVKEVDERNQEMVFGPLKSLCGFISEIILELNPVFAYPKSLASTLIETAHDQHFFSEHLPRLTDNNSKMEHKKYVLAYLKLLAFSAIK